MKTKLLILFCICIVSLSTMAQPTEVQGTSTAVYAQLGEANAPGNVEFRIQYKVFAYAGLRVSFAPSIFASSHEIIYYYKGKSYMSTKIPELKSIRVKGFRGTVEVYNDKIGNKIIKNIEASVGGNNGALGENSILLLDKFPDGFFETSTTVNFTATSLLFDANEANRAIERYLAKEKEAEQKQAAEEKLKKETQQKQNTKTEGNAAKGEMSSDLQKGSMKETDDDFWNEKPTNSDKGGDNEEYERRKAAEEKKARQEKETIDKVNRIMEEGERRREENSRKLDAWSNNLHNTFYAAQAASDSRTRLNENSKLSGNYGSVQELEAEFNQKYNAISYDTQQYKEASSQSIQQGANLLFNDGTATGQATGEFVGLLGAMVNNASAEKEARERREQLEKQRKEEETKIKQRKWNAIVELRAKLFEQFADGGTPLSKHNIQQPQVYCFVYSIDPATLKETQPNLYISNVFPVAQYSDGTWPFKNTLVADIKKKTKTSGVVLMGYYTQKDLAEQMRNGLINLSPKAQLKALAIEYKGTEAKTSTTNTDFWGTETKTDSAKETQKTTNDFWETGKKEANKETKKNNDDFWDN